MAEKKAAALFQNLKNCRILLIDDDPSVRVSLVILFEFHGCSIHAVKSAEEAIEAFEGKQFDIVITDYQLPGMSGLEFFDRIKDAHPQPLKIFITAYGSDDVYAEAHRLGVRDIIEKPLNKRKIVDTLSKMMGVRDSGDAPPKVC